MRPIELLRPAILAAGITLIASGGARSAVEGESLPPPSTPDTNPTHIVINNPTSTPIPIFEARPTGNFSRANDPTTWESKIPTATPRIDDNPTVNVISGSASYPEGFDCRDFGSDTEAMAQCFNDTNTGK